jgi:pyruvate,water dikinase
MSSYVRRLTEIGRDDVQQCGGKGANLGELSRLGLRVPAGFCVIADALPYVLGTNSLTAPIAEAAARLEYDDAAALEAETARIRARIRSATLPAALETEIVDAYRGLVGDGNRYVAVRSSVAVKDSPISSFPGLMDTYHFVLGEADVLRRIRECWASLWTARAAFVRHEQEIAHERGLIAPIVQIMVNADTAGVLLTANPVTSARDEIVVEANWGIGESVVSGAAVADHFVLDKETLAVETARVARKNLMVTIDQEKGAGRAERPVPEQLSSAPTLSDSQLEELGGAGKVIEEHFGFEADVEWAYERGELYVLQARRVRNLAPTV